jgi:hypothetical protein
MPRRTLDRAGLLAAALAVAFGIWFALRHIGKGVAEDTNATRSVPSTASRDEEESTKRQAPSIAVHRRTLSSWLQRHGRAAPAHAGGPQFNRAGEELSELLAADPTVANDAKSLIYDASVHFYLKVQIIMAVAALPDGSTAQEILRTWALDSTLADSLKVTVVSAMGTPALAPLETLTLLGSIARRMVGCLKWH